MNPIDYLTVSNAAGIKPLPHIPGAEVGELSNMCHPSCTINKVNNNDYCTWRSVPGTMAHSRIKE